MCDINSEMQDALLEPVTLVERFNIFEIADRLY